MSNIKKTVEYYMGLPYEKTIKEVPKDEGGGYVVSVPRLGSSSTYAWGESESEALEAIREIMHDNFKSWIEGGYPIPEPDAEDKKYSGKILLRTTSGVHKFLAEMANDQSISLNQLLNNIMHEAIGAVKATPEQVVEHHYMLASPECMVIRSKNYDIFRTTTERQKEIAFQEAS